MSLRPSAQVLLAALQDLAPAQAKNFESVTTEVPGLVLWLAGVVGSSLEWILDEDAREDIWTCASQRMSERCGRTASPDQQRHFEISMPNDTVLDVEIHEPALTGDNLGLKTWGSALVCANRLVRERHVLRSPVLELGSGTGLTAIVAAKLGCDIVATDLPEIVPNLERNVRANCDADGPGTCSVDCAVLDWTDPRSFADTRSGQNKTSAFKTVLVADPIYSPEHPAMVCAVIDAFLAREPDARLCVQLPLREKFDDVRADFYQRLSNIGLVRHAYSEEAGRDDFGETTYGWSVWRRSL